MRDRRHIAVALTLFLGSLAAGSPVSAGGLDVLLGRDTSALLPVERAFAVRLTRSAVGVPVLDWDIAPGYYLYRDRLRVEAIPSRASRVQVTAALPEGEMLDDAAFGRVPVYRGQIAIPLAVQPPGATPAKLRVHYQGCAQDRACYTPAVRVLTMEAP